IALPPGRGGKATAPAWRPGPPAQKEAHALPRAPVMKTRPQAVGVVSDTRRLVRPLAEDDREDERDSARARGGKVTAPAQLSSSPPRPRVDRVSRALERRQPHCLGDERAAGVGEAASLRLGSFNSVRQALSLGVVRG